MPKETRETTLSYQLYERYRNKKDEWNFDNYIQEAQDFYNGDQYPNDNYKNMIRVSMNICSFSTNIKASKIVGTPIYIQYTSDDNDVDCVKLQRFDEYNQSKLNEKTENFQSALNGFNNGTEIAFYRWDKYDTSYKGIYKGGLVLEHIDPRNFAVENPKLADIQNQKWIMYWSDEEVEVVRNICEGDEKMKELIVPDDYSQQVDRPNRVNSRTVRVYTRMFKLKGEVFFMCSTKDVDLFKYPHAMNPKASERIAERIQKELDKKLKGEPDENLMRIPDFDVDYEDVMLPYLDDDMLSESEYKTEKEKFSLYPVAIYVPFAINNKWFGRSDIQSIIPIQKGINFGISMMLMCAQNNAYNKIFAKEGALRGQEITNDPGQVLTDYSKMTNGWGIKMAESQPMPNGLIDFTDRLLAMTRVVYGFNDVMDGSITNQDISGYAIQQMIKQSNSAIEQQQQLFWKFCKDKAAIRLQFYKFFVDSAKFTYDIEDFEVHQEEEARNKLQMIQQRKEARGEKLEIGDIDLSKKTEKTKTDTISKDEIYGINFDINIDVMQGLVDSKLAESQMWDTLVMNGGIQNLEPEMLELYLEANPMVSVRTKQVLRSVVAKQKQSENQVLKEQLQQATSLLQQAQQYILQMQSQNGYMKEYTKNLTNEFGNKISAANKTITAQNKLLAQQAQQKMGDGEVKSNNSRGIAGTTALPSQQVNQ